MHGFERPLFEGTWASDYGLDSPELERPTGIYDGLGAGSARMRPPRTHGRGDRGLDMTCGTQRTVEILAVQLESSLAVG
jgi:hypothetical protein